MKLHALFVYLAICVLTGCEQKISRPNVVAFYPSSDTLPDNILRMYVSFSTPMKTRGNLEKIRLLDALGNEIESPLLEMNEELWDVNQQQLTILFDPSRVKTGLIAHQQLGRALRQGQTYQLRIEGVENVDHQKLVRPYIKQFHVVESDTVAPDIKKWAIKKPDPQTMDPLIVTFKGVVDQFSLRHRLVLTDDKKEPVLGQVEIGSYETQWHFTPHTPWLAGEYVLHVNARLADPAGNNLNGLFDHEAGALRFEKEGELLTLDIQIE